MMVPPPETDYLNHPLDKQCLFGNGRFVGQGVARKSRVRPDHTGSRQRNTLWGLFGGLRNE